MNEFFEQHRFGATVRACRALRHEFATPLSAAVLHFELARRAAVRASEDVPERLRASLETGRKQLDEAVELLEGFSALGRAHEGEPGLVDFAALVSRVAESIRPELKTRSLSFLIEGPSRGIYVDGFEDEIEGATREVVLTAARWAAPGEGLVEIGSDAAMAYVLVRLPLEGARPGETLFRARSRPGAGIGPWLARWAFEANAGRVESEDDGANLTVTASLPQVALS